MIQQRSGFTKKNESLREKPIRLVRNNGFLTFKEVRVKLADMQVDRGI